MKTKFTLWLDKDLIETAKKYADEKGISVSQLVSNYFALLRFQESLSKADKRITPVSSKLSGILKESDVSEEDYKNYLEEKYN